MALAAGTRLGSYEILSLAGAGGMGEVYRAHDKRLERLVAIKVLPDSAFGDPAARARLVREARTASKLNHPNICTIHEVSEADGQAYIVMELVEGQSLSGRLVGGPLRGEQILHYARQLADALAHAHARGVVHRDLKSSNVMVTPDDRVKVLDFGLARYVSGDELAQAVTSFNATVTEPGVLAGTIAYMSPEQLRGRPADARSDVWALGVVLYELATGRLPFAGNTGFDTSAAILNTSPAPLPDSTSPRVRDLVATCLEKDPERRFRDGRELVAAVQQDGAAQPRAFGHRWVRHPRSRLATVAGVAAIAFAIALALDVGRLRPFVVGLFSKDVVAFAARDWVLLAAFDNQTADSVFDKSLDTALAVGMGQSSYLNIVPPSQIRAALRRMKRPESSSIDGATAREIAQRENVRVVLVPSISEIGGVYQLAGSIVDPVTGGTLKSVVVRAQAKTDVLEAVDELIAGVRSDLGEARSSASLRGKPLAQVTTSSLVALKVFSLAREAHAAARIDEARGLYEEALRLDPGFTGARASLGILNFELRDREKGRELLAESIKEVDGLTDKERASIVAFHAEAIESDLQKAADTYIPLLAMYPDAGTVHNNLGRLYMKMGKYDLAVASLKEALRLEPDVMLTYNSLGQVYLYGLGDLDAAVALSQQQLARSDENEFAYDSLGWAWLGKGELALAEEAFQRVLSINPRATLDLFRLGHTYRLQARHREARDTFLKIPTIDPAEDSAYYDAGVAAQLMGDLSGARAHFMQFRQLLDGRIRKNTKNAAQYFELANVRWQLGDREGAADAAARGLALDAKLHFEHAGFLALQDRKEEALSQLELAVDRGFRNFVWMKIHVDLESVAAEPRFQALIARGLKQSTPQ